jgi:hypothetical protein
VPDSDDANGVKHSSNHFNCVSSRSFFPTFLDELCVIFCEIFSRFFSG